MAKKKSSGAYLTPGEQVGGTALLLLYLLVLPWAAPMLFDLAGHLLGISLSAAVRAALYYAIFAAVTAAVFHRFLWRTSEHLVSAPGAPCRSFLLGLVGLYGMNELALRLLAAAGFSGRDLNASALSGGGLAPVLGLILVPFIEEVLFRGLVFGGLRGQGRAAAYGASCVLFAAWRMWRLVGGPNALVLVEYLVPGAVLCWAYESSGTLWAAFAVHAVFNLLAAWPVL